MKNLNAYIQQLKKSPETTDFDELMALISHYYDYRPVAFSNGDDDNTVYNPAGQNEGSCRIFSFARIHGLDREQTLHCFGRYYREDVLLHPGNDDHANIRQFMKHGWAGIRFEGTALTPKRAATTVR